MAYKVNYRVSYHKGQMFIAPYPSPEFNQFIEYTLIDNTSTDPISTHLPNFTAINDSADTSREYTFTLKDGTKTNDLNIPIKDVEKVSIAYLDGQYSQISFSGLKYIEFIDKLKVNKYWTNLERTFSGCSNLVSVNMENWDTSNVVNMFGMFNNCSSLTSIDLSNFNTSKVTNINTIFARCSSLTSVDLTGWDTSNVINMSSMFKECPSLTSIDLSDLDTSSVVNMSSMFSNCSSLTSLDLSKWDTSSVEYSDRMFIGCQHSCIVYYNSLRWTLPTSGEYFDVTFVDINSYFTFDLSLGDSNTIVLVDQDNNGNLALTSWGDGTIDSNLTHTYANVGTYTVITNLHLGQCVSDEIYGGQPALSSTKNSPVIESVIDDLDREFVNQRPMPEIATYFDNATSKIRLLRSDVPMMLSGDIIEEGKDTHGNPLVYKDINTAKSLVSARLCRIKDLRFYFSCCINLASVDLTHFHAPEADDMQYMFNECRSLRTITGIEDIDVSNIKYMWRTFAFLDTYDAEEDPNSGEITALNYTINLDLSKWDVRNVEELTFTFGGCSTLTTLNLTGWVTDKLNSLYQTFAMSPSLTEIKGLEDFNTSKVTTLCMTFLGCNALTSLDLSKWEVSNVDNMEATFDQCFALESLNLSNWNTSKVTNMIFLFAYCHALKNVTGLDSFNTSNVNNMQYMFYACQTINNLNLSSFDTSKVTDMYAMFGHCHSMTNLIGIDSFDTKNVKDICCMFQGCSGLTSLNLSNWDVRRVNISYNVFYGCSNLVELNLTGWELASTDLYAFFAFCSKLKYVDVSKFKTNNVYDISAMFYECTVIDNLDTSNWYLGNVLEAEQTFWYTDSLKKLDTSNWYLGKLQYAYGFFAHCPMLEALDTSRWYCTEIIDMMTMFSYLDKVKYLDLSHFDTSKCKCFQWTFNAGISLQEIKGIENLNTSNVTTMKETFDSCYNLKELDLRKWDTSKVTDMSMMFYNCNKLEKLNLDTWDVSKVTNMSNIFYNCRSLKEFHLYNFTKTIKSPTLNTNALTNIPNTAMIFVASNDNVIKTTYPDLYYIYRNEITIDLSKPWHCITEENPAGSSTVTKDLSFKNTIGDVKNDIKATYLVDWGDGTLNYELYHEYETSGTYTVYTMNFPAHYDLFAQLESYSSGDRTIKCKVSNYPYTSFHSAFTYCENLALEQLDLSIWDTSKCTDFTNTFAAMTFTTIDLPNLDLSSAENLSGMFSSCTKLTTLDLSSWDISHVTNLEAIFSQCSNLKSINLTGWDTSNVTDISQMFANCTSLTSVDLSHFDTGNVTNMVYLFSNCKKLTTLDLSSWDTSNLSLMGGMFYNCTSLTSLNTTGWVTDKVYSAWDTFRKCTKLTNLDLSHWYLPELRYGKNMFDGCTALKTLDLSGWTSESGSQIVNGVQWYTGEFQEMFKNCSALESINLSNLNTDLKDAKITNMFIGVPASVNWNYDGTNYANWKYTEEETGYSGTFPWNQQ